MEVKSINSENVEITDKRVVSREDLRNQLKLQKDYLATITNEFNIKKALVQQTIDDLKAQIII